MSRTDTQSSLLDADGTSFTCHDPPLFRGENWLSLRLMRPAVRSAVDVRIEKVEVSVDYR